MNGSPPEIPPHKLISALRGYDLLPAIVFMPTRRKCDEAATETAFDRSQPNDKEKFERRRAIFDEYAAENPEVLKHKHRKILVDRGVASHHAGHIPAWKLLIEKMMSDGALNAIFATSTVAAGVDFPARTVVVINADTRGNDGWRPLGASELQQMTGRAGRRGKDNVGFVVVAPGQFQDPKKIAELLKAPPDPLESHFRATYTTLLNLLDAFDNFGQIREIAEKSFAFRKTSKQINRLEKDAERNIGQIDQLIAETPLTVDDVRGFERLVAARERLHGSIPVTRAEMRRKWLEENVVPGRIVTQGRSGKRFYMVINSHSGKVSAMRDDGGGTSFDIGRVNRIYGNVYGLRADSVEQAFFDTFEGRNKPVTEPNLNERTAVSDEASQIFDKAIESIGKIAGGEAPLWESLTAAQSLVRITRDIEILRDQIWQPFERRAKVLDHYGYIVRSSETTTESGKWLADLRVDRPLLVGEALRRGLFDGLTPQVLAGLVAAIAADSDRNYGDIYLSDELLELLPELEDIIFDVSNIEWKYGIEPVEELNTSAAAAAERWAAGISWETLVDRSKAEEGDLFRLLARTGEALIQLARLGSAYPEAAALAATTADSLLRDPIR